MANKAIRSVIFTLLVLVSGNLTAQVQADLFAKLEAPAPGSGTIRIKQDATIRNMVNIHLSQQHKQNGIKGHRICIYYNSGQEANKGADAERSRFISRYEDINSYKSFEYPFFKVYVGDFRTKSEALRFLDRIKYDYPNAFIRSDIMVAFPK